MKIIETKSSSLLSIIIRWAFSSKGSHIAIVFDNDRWLVHSNLLGVNIRLFKSYFGKHKDTKIVDSIEYSLAPHQEEEVFQSLIERTSENEYDYPGFIYFAWRGLLFKLFKTPLPKKNRLGDSSMELCTEMVKKLPMWITGVQESVDLGITTPDKVMMILREVKK